MNRSLMAIMAALIIVTAFSGNALAVSQAGAISLTFPIGARYNALGESGTALSTDLTAMWWNVGGYAFAADGGKRRGFEFMDTKLVPDLASDVRLDFLGYGQYVEGWGMMGAYITYLNNGVQQRTDESGQNLGTFKSYEFAIGFAYGVKITPKMGVGVGVKYFRNELAPDSATQDRGSGSGSTWAIDTGLHYRVNNELQLGAALTNLGPDITFIDADQSDPMPLTLRLGASMVAYQSEYMGFLVVTDYLKSLVSQDNTQIFGGGIEWNYVESLFIRLGYKHDQEGEIKDYTWGLGVDLSRWTGQSVSVNYASVPQATGLDRVSRISLSFLF